MIKNQLKNSRSIALVLSTAAVALALVSCKKEQPPAAPPAQPQPPAAQKQQAVQKVATSATAKPQQAVSQFDFSTKKDPFKPFIVVKKAVALTPEEQKKAMRNALPIHSFDVNQFKLIGIVTGAKENQAMVVDPTGKGYVLKLGMLIGKNDGKVTLINNTGVEILEQFKDDNGRVRKESIKLTLPRKQ